MDLYGRYVFRQLVNAFLLILLTLTCIVWFATALSRLELLTAQGQSAVMFLKMTSLILPSLVALIAPNAFLMACLHTLDRLNGDSELIVMTASGASIWRIARPFLVLAGIVAVSILVINVWLQPWSQRTLRTYITEVRSDLISQVLQPGRFSSPEPGLTFHIRDRGRDGQVYGLLIHDARKSDRVMTYLAERSRIVKSGGGAYLVMHDGHIQQRKPEAKTESKADTVSIVKFDQYAFDLSDFGPKSEVSVYQPRERYIGELAYPTQDDVYAKAYPGQLRAELHERLSSPLYPIVFVMVAIALLGKARTNRQNRWKFIIGAFSIGILARVLGLAGKNLVVISPGAAVLVYGMPLIFIAIAAWRATSAGPLLPRHVMRYVDMARASLDAVKGTIGRGLPFGLARGRAG